MVRQSAKKALAAARQMVERAATRHRNALKREFEAMARIARKKRLDGVREPLYKLRAASTYVGVNRLSLEKWPIAWWPAFVLSLAGEDGNLKRGRGTSTTVRPVGSRRTRPGLKQACPWVPGFK